MNKLDILNRDIFVEQLLSVVENISANKASTCFAINGVWGCGKSFVLDLFQEKLEQIQSEETAMDKYFVIRYNSWKYDYYDEPLVAIVASIISIIEEKIKLMPDKEINRILLGSFKAIAITLLSIGNTAIKGTTGIDFKKAYQTVCNGSKKELEAYKNKNKYDAYFSFNKILEKLGELLQDLAQEYTIVLIVDELDRCLPEYCIKVLERLHHLTEDKSNIITIISMDKEQLKSSIKTIFGFENPDKYLEKFINFDIKLDYGEISDTVCEKYADYLALFDKDIYPFTEPIEECIRAIFMDIDIRSQEKLIQKAMLAHTLLYSDKKDYSFLCMELLLVVMICKYHNDSCLTDATISLENFDKIFMPFSNNKPAFSNFFKNKFENIKVGMTRDMVTDSMVYVLPENPNLYAAILFTWYWLHKSNRNYIIRINKDGVNEPISNNHNELKKFIEFIRMIK